MAITKIVQFRLVQFRLSEEGLDIATAAGGNLKKYDHNEEPEIPPIGTIVDLYPVTRGLAKVVSIADEVASDSPESPERRFITLYVEPI